MVRFDLEAVGNSLSDVAKSTDGWRRIKEAAGKGWKIIEVTRETQEAMTLGAVKVGAQRSNYFPFLLTHGTLILVQHHDEELRAFAVPDSHSITTKYRFFIAGTKRFASSLGSVEKLVGIMDKIMDEKNSELAAEKATAPKRVTILLTPKEFAVYKKKNLKSAIEEAVRKIIAEQS